MTLSFTLRLVCLALAGQGILQLAAELLLYVAAPLLLRILAPFPMRHRERLLYAIQVVPFFASLLLNTLLCLPQYAHGETNLTVESVGKFSLLLTAAVTICFGAAALRGLLLILRTHRFTRTCRHSGTVVAAPDDSTPVLALGTATGIALLGLVRPVILIAPRLPLTPEALAVALDHERAHARQFDNWKLLTLHTLPLLTLRLASGRTWMQHWQAAAELAADDDAAGPDPHRAILLAESLLTVARLPKPSTPQLLITSLTCVEPDLTQRIERLLHSRPAPPLATPLAAIVSVACATMGLAFWIADHSLTASALHTLAERLLHLG